MEVFVQQQFRVGNKLRPAAGEQDAIGPRSGAHAEVRARIQRVLDHDDPVDRLSEHLLERGIDLARQAIATANHGPNGAGCGAGPSCSLKKASLRSNASRVGCPASSMRWLVNTLCAGLGKV